MWLDNMTCQKYFYTGLTNTPLGEAKTSCTKKWFGYELNL